MLYAIPCAALTAALLTLTTAALWRCRTLRRALTRERATRRLADAAWARDIQALTAQQHATACRTAQEAAGQAVIDEAHRIITAALAVHAPETPRGGTDG